MSKKEIDWELLEREWRAGAMTNVQLAKRHGTIESTIRYRAKTYGWQRDLRGMLKDEVQRQIIQQDSQDSQFAIPETAKPSRARGRKRKGPTPPDPEKDLEAVKGAAARVVEIINHHKRLTQAAYKGVSGIQDEINKLLDRVINIGGSLSADDIKALSQAQRQNSYSLANVINADRRSYAIDEGNTEDAPDSIRLTFYRNPDALKPK